MSRIAENQDQELAAEMRRLRDIDQGEPLGIESFRRILAGESPLRVWREDRGIGLRLPAERLGISARYLSDVEAGKKEGSVEILRAIARELHVSLDDLLRPGT